MKSSTRKEIFSLPDNERIGLARDLLNSVSQGDDKDFTSEDLALIDERLACDKAHPEDAIPLAEMRKKYRHAASPEEAKLIEERIAYADAHPDKMVSWGQIRKDLRESRKRKKRSRSVHA